MKCNLSLVLVSKTDSCTGSQEEPNGSRRHRRAEPVLTVDTPGLVAVVRAVVNFITLFGAVDAGPVTALELIGSTCQQGCGAPGEEGGKKSLGHIPESS